MRVDLPSSTEPAVAMRSNVAILNSPVASLAPSEVALSFTVFHACFGDAVVGAGGAPFGQTRHRGLGDHLGHRAGKGLHAAGAGDIADRAEPHRLLDDWLVLARLQ